MKKIRMMRKYLFIIFLLLAATIHADTINDENYGLGYISANYLKLDQSAPQTVTASPAITTLTSGYLPYANATKQLVNSPVYTDGTNVGIGTTSPKSKLDVEGGVAVGATYSGTSVAPSNGAIIEGNVGIGTTNPGAKLEVSIPSSASGNDLIRFSANGGNYGSIQMNATNDTIKFQANANASNLTLDATAAATGNIYITPKSTANVIISQGNVGIGTTGPGYKLQVNGDIVSGITGTDGSFKTTRSFDGVVIGSFSTEGTNALRIRVEGGNSYIAFQTQSTADAVRIIDNGNVGIGTTGPVNKLSVYDDSQQELIHFTRGAKNGGIGINGGGTDYATGIWYGGSVVGSFDSNGGLALGTYAPATTPPANGMIIDGNVGIGTTGPGAYLHIKAGTATANTAPIKIDPGVVNTTPVSGCIESDGTDLWWVDSTNTRRKLNN